MLEVSSLEKLCDTPHKGALTQLRDNYLSYLNTKTGQQFIEGVTAAQKPEDRNAPSRGGGRS